MSVWYIGDPCYAIEDERWGEFCEIMWARRDGLKAAHDKNYDPFEGDGFSFNWEWIDEDGDERTNRVYVYNSGLGGDGTVNVQGGLCVDAGLLSVMPIGLCKRLALTETSVGNHGCHAVVESRFRPVFDIDTNNHPHVLLTIDGEIQQDNTGYQECDECGEWQPEADIIWSNTQGAVGDCCYLGEEE